MGKLLKYKSRDVILNIPNDKCSAADHQARSYSWNTNSNLQKYFIVFTKYTNKLTL